VDGKTVYTSEKPVPLLKPGGVPIRLTGPLTGENQGASFWNEYRGRVAVGGERLPIAIEKRKKQIRGEKTRETGGQQL